MRKMLFMAVVAAVFAAGVCKSETAKGQESDPMCNIIYEKNFADDECLNNIKRTAERLYEATFFKAVSLIEEDTVLSLEEYDNLTKTSCLIQKFLNRSTGKYCDVMFFFGTYVFAVVNPVADLNTKYVGSAKYKTNTYPDFETSISYIVSNPKEVVKESKGGEITTESWTPKI